MLVGIVSDTHDQVKRLEGAALLLKEKGAERLFHCGDITGPEAVGACRSLKTYFAQGNNDHQITEIKKAVQQIGGVFLGLSGEVELVGKRIAITHGSDLKEFRFCLDSEPDYLLVGHSHKASHVRQGKTMVINPGALHRVAIYTCALLNVDNAKIKFLEIPKTFP